MPTVSKSGSRSASRRSWQSRDRAGSLPGPCPRPRRSSFAQLALALRTLIRFHHAHPEWFPPRAEALRPPVPPDWDEAISRLYGSPTEVDPKK